MSHAVFRRDGKEELFEEAWAQYTCLLEPDFLPSSFLPGSWDYPLSPCPPPPVPATQPSPPASPTSARAREKENVKVGRKGPVLRMCHPGGPLQSQPPTSTQWEPVPLLFVTLNESNLLHILGGGN